MTISELICRLQEVKCEHGDLEVRIASRNIDCGKASSVLVYTTADDRMGEVKTNFTVYIRGKID